MTNIQKGLTWIIIAGLFSIPFIQFIVTRSLLFPFITGKGFTFRIITEIIFACWVYLAVSDPAYRPRWNFITKAILVFLGIVFLADISGVYAFKSLWSNFERMEGFVLIAHLVAYYFVLTSTFSAQSNKELWWRNFWNVNLFSSVILSIYGALQLAGKITINQGGVRLDGTFGNSSYFAIYTVFCMFIALALLYREKNTFLQWAYGVVFVLNGVMLYFTATRGSILGFIGGIIVTALLVIWREHKTDEQSQFARKIAIGLLGSIVVLVAVFMVVRNTNFVKNNQVLSRFSSLSVSELETQGRYYVWPMAIKGMEERPILGWGQENFNYVFNKYYNPAMYSQEQWFDRTHDIFLDWLINAGVLGLLSYISLFVSLIYMLWKKSTLALEEKALLSGLVCAYIFHNIFVFDNIISYIMFFSVLSWISSVSSGTVKEDTNHAKTFSADTLNYFVGPIVLIGLVSCLYFVNVPALQASSDLISALSQQKDGVSQSLDYFTKAFAHNSFGSPEIVEQLVSTAIQVVPANQFDATVRQGFYELTDKQIKIQIQKTPHDARYLLLGGSFYNRVGQYDSAISLLTDAVKYSPAKPAMYFELGSSYLGKGDKAKAFDLFTQGYNLEKDSPDSKIVYAIGALYVGRSDIVKQMFSEVGKDVVLNDNRILQTYMNIKDYSSAEIILTTRLTKDPQNYNLELQLASVYATAGDKAKAISLIQDVENKVPSAKAQLDPYIKQLSQ